MSGADVPVRIRGRIVQVDVETAIRAIVRVATDDSQGAVHIPKLFYFFWLKGTEGKTPLFASQIHLSKQAAYKKERRRCPSSHPRTQRSGGRRNRNSRHSPSGHRRQPRLLWLYLSSSNRSNMLTHYRLPL